MPQKKQAVTKDRFDGPLKERLFGLRIDDDVVVTVMAGDIPRRIEGRLLRFSRETLEVLDTSGVYHLINRDWLVEVALIRHNRPHPRVDEEYKKRSEKAEEKEDNSEAQQQVQAEEDNPLYM